jgi:hypothetical protein
MLDPNPDPRCPSDEAEPLAICDGSVLVTCERGYLLDEVDCGAPDLCFKDAHCRLSASPDPRCSASEYLHSHCDGDVLVKEIGTIGPAPAPRTQCFGVGAPARFALGEGFFPKNPSKKQQRWPDVEPGANPLGHPATARATNRAVAAGPSGFAPHPPGPPPPTAP